MYRIEIVEKDVYMNPYYADVERISSPVRENETVEAKVKYFLELYKNNIKSGKYYIKVIYVNVNKEEN